MMGGMKLFHLTEEKIKVNLMKLHLSLKKKSLFKKQSQRILLLLLSLNPYPKNRNVQNKEKRKLRIKKTKKKRKLKRKRKKKKGETILLTMKKMAVNGLIMKTYISILEVETQSQSKKRRLTVRYNQSSLSQVISRCRMLLSR